MYKFMARELEEMEEGAERLLFKGPTIPEEVAKYEEPVDLDSLLDGLTLAKLEEIFEPVLRRGDNRPGEKQLWNHKKRAGKSGRKAHLRTVLCQKKQEVQFQADAGILQGQDGDRRFLSGSAGTDEGRKNPPVTGIHRR